MFTIKKMILYTIENTFTKDFINGWGCKSQQNFDNRIIFMLWRNSQLSIKLFEREPPQYRVLSKKKKMEQVQHKLHFYVLL